MSSDERNCVLKLQDEQQDGGWGCSGGNRPVPEQGGEAGSFCLRIYHFPLWNLFRERLNVTAIYKTYLVD
jgi:hypothetical protein